MSRRHSRPPSSPTRRFAPATPTSAAGQAAVLAGDLPFRLTVDQVLAQMAAERAAANRDAEPVSRSKAAGPTLTTLPVAGMTCRSCENRIARHVSRIPNVLHVRASAVHGRVEIESSAPIAAVAIARAIRSAGYEIGGTPWLERNPAVWATAIGGIVLVAVVALLAQATGLAGLASGAGDLSKGGIAVALLLGLAAGVSTCMALVGGLVLALSASFESRRRDGDDTSSVFGRMRPGLVFMAGRIAGYGVLGAALGAVGASVTLPPQVTAALMIMVAVVMTILGTRLTGVSPRIAAWSPTLPMGLGRRLGLGDGAAGAYSDSRAAGLGAATFFMPCGFTQAVQIYALSTGSPLLAGAIMATFAVGTAPGLLALAGLPIVVPSGMRPTLLRLVGVVVLGFALVNAEAGIRLSGITLPSLGVATVAAAPLPVSGVAADGTQALTTHQDAGGYSPGNVSIYAGIPTHWTIESSTASTCAAFLVVPKLGIQARLHVGSNTIELPALPVGTISYSCAMGMYGGRLTVVDPPTGATNGASNGG